MHPRSGGVPAHNTQTHSLEHTHTTLAVTDSAAQQLAGWEYAGGREGQVWSISGNMSLMW